MSKITSKFSSALDLESTMKRSIVAEVIKLTGLKENTRTFIHIQDPHYKFYQVYVNGSELITCYGRIGVSGSKTGDIWDSPEAAQREANRIIRSKLNKGYEEPVPMDEKAPKPAKKPKKLTPEGLSKLEVFLSSLK